MENGDYLLPRGEVFNFLRSLDMIEDALNQARTFFEKQSEAEAARHNSTKVMYSPIVTTLSDAQIKVAAMVDTLDAEGVYDQVRNRPTP